MRVLIIGGSSVIGKALAARLADIAEVRLAGRRDADLYFDLSEWREIPDVQESFDVVIHVAADFGGSQDEDFVRAELVNSVGTLSVCSLARRTQAKHFVLISSIFATYALGDQHYGIYALSKRHGEEVAQLFCAKRGIGLSILRPTQVYDDEGACRRHQSLFYLVADRAQGGQEIVFYGTHDAWRNYLHIEDLAEICLRVVARRCTGIYACAHPRSVRLTEIASAAFAAFEQSEKVRFLTDKPDLADVPEIRDYALYDCVEYYPRIDIVQGYRRIKEYRERNP